MSNFLQEQDPSSQCKTKHSKLSARGSTPPKIVEHRTIYKYLNILLLVFLPNLRTLYLQKTPFPRSKCKVEKIEHARTVEQNRTPSLHKKLTQLLD
jgi:hypothetical protein